MRRIVFCIMALALFSAQRGHAIWFYHDCNWEYYQDIIHANEMSALGGGCANFGWTGGGTPVESRGICEAGTRNGLGEWNWHINAVCGTGGCVASGILLCAGHASPHQVFILPTCHNSAHFDASLSSDYSGAACDTHDLDSHGHDVIVEHHECSCSSGDEASCS